MLVVGNRDQYAVWRFDRSWVVRAAREITMIAHLAVVNVGVVPITLGGTGRMDEPMLLGAQTTAFACAGDVNVRVVLTVGMGQEGGAAKRPKNQDRDENNHHQAAHDR